MIRVQNAEVFVHRRGPRGGTPLLLIHGNPDSHRMWLPMIEHLADRFDCIAPDLPGFGASALPANNDVSLAGFARWTDDLIAALELDQPVDLMVHDIGGFYGLAWAALHPDKLRRLVVSNTLLHADYQWHFWARVWRSGLGELSMKAFDWPVIGPTALGITMRIGGPLLTKAQLDETFANFHPTARAQVLRIYRETDPAKFAPWEQPMLACTAQRPTRVIWGARDPFIPLSFCQCFGAADVQVLTDAGHWVAAEAPERVADLVREHLTIA